ncbi:MAG: right-handed parallel beta-helix repeat-containing protein, partial [Acidimicrobiia bacterium]|nr:right-handed parallel beta-helix repeat-containing protein [Acidimicrobiia bacterium]
EGNLGHGIHTDRGSDDVLIEGNLVRANLGAGIHHEISGAAMIADNTVVGNGFAPGRPPEPGILVLGSSSTTVASNMVEANALGIVIRQDERVDEGVLRSVAVSDNTVISAGGPVAVVGGSTGVDDDRAWLAEVQFSANSYVLTSGDMFRWDGLPVDAGGWQAAGQDSEGRFSGG